MKFTALAITALFMVQLAAFAIGDDNKPPPKKPKLGIWAGFDGKGCIRGLENSGPGRAHALRKAKIETLIAKAKNVDVGAGRVAETSYSSVAYKVATAKKDIKADMKEYEARGVTFKTAGGVEAVESLMYEAMGEALDAERKALIEVMKGLAELEVLQGVVFRGLTGGANVGYSYFSQPYQIFYYIQLADGTGRRVEVLIDTGD